LVNGLFIFRKDYFQVYDYKLFNYPYFPASGPALVFIHIFGNFYHPLGRSATLENQPALKAK